MNKLEKKEIIPIWKAVKNKEYICVNIGRFDYYVLSNYRVEDKSSIPGVIPQSAFFHIIYALRKPTAFYISLLNRRFIGLMSGLCVYKFGFPACQKFTMKEVCQMLHNENFTKFDYLEIPLFTSNHV